ncbi:sulfite exporter TauE/SafE family protein [Halomonas sp. 15WGF]|uniref:TSUP family transporter n=1 Tax=Halomonas sp. 15WGF TaxID=2570357 RepID=UPI001485636F|nr:sulfite exporter TauE/SafE family protein [Halomonas sp. 15WGF]
MTDVHWLLPGTLLALLAGGIRGYTGFGFAMTLALGLLWFLPPLQVIVVVLMLDILGALGLARRAWKAAEKTLLARLVPAMLGMSLLGTLVMASLPYHVAKLLIAGLCLVGAVATFLPSGLISRSRRRDRIMAVPAGAASGLAMAVASAGGPPLMLYLMHTTLGAAQARATAIVFFYSGQQYSTFRL